MLTRLLVLWLLSEGPLHGYRIKKILDEGTLRFWFPIEVGSIYAVLGSLVREDHIRKEAVERQGRRPERTLYRITPAGRSHLQDLLRQAWRELPRLGDPIHMALAARSELPEADVAAMLLERRGRLRDRLVELDRVADSAPAPEMVGRLRALTQAELQWLEELLEKDGIRTAINEEGET